jgi:hypothetical protein
MGTPGAALGSETPGAVVIGPLAATDSVGSYATGAVTAHPAAEVKIVKYASGGNTDGFADAAAYSNEAVTDDDFFIFGVTAEDGSKLYYRVMVTAASFEYVLETSNVSGASAPSNVRFFLADDDVLAAAGVYMNITYEDVIDALGSPVTSIYNLDAGKYLYAVEFTGMGSGTVAKYGVSTPLAGNGSDESLSITLITALSPPDPPEAGISSGDTITATVANTGGNNGVGANTDIVITLTHAKAAAALSGDDVSDYVSPAVEGLTYLATASAGDTTITIEVRRNPLYTSTASVTITIPGAALKDDNGYTLIADLEVDGAVTYAIDRAPDPDISGFDFTPTGGLKVGNANVAAGAVVGTFSVSTGTPPYSYTLTGTGNDNTSFTIDGASLKAGGAALATAKTYTVGVKVTDAAGKEDTGIFDLTVVDPISDFEFTKNSKIVVGNAPGGMGGPSDYEPAYPYTTAGTFTTSGGNGSYAYSLVVGAGDTDNALFSIGTFGDSNKLLVNSGGLGLTEAKTYSVRVQVSSGGETSTEQFSFPIGYAPAAGPLGAAVDGYGFDITITAVKANIDSVGGEAANTSITINLTNGGTVDGTGVDASGWFSPTVAGLTYIADLYGNVGYITVAGVPTAVSAGEVTITIPADKLLDSNGNPSITSDLPVTVTNGGSPSDNVIKYAVTEAPLDFLKAFNNSGVEVGIYSSFDQAMTAAGSNGTVKVFRSAEIAATVTLPGISNFAVTIQAESSDVTLTRSPGFTGTLFDVNGKRLSIGGSASGVLIIDGNKANVDVAASLVSVYPDYSNFTLLSNARLQNNAGAAVSVIGTGYYTGSYFYMDGGVIAGNTTGVYLVGTKGDFAIAGGIIYGNSAGGNANGVSLSIGDSKRDVSNTTGTGPASFTINTDYTETFGSAP